VKLNGSRAATTVSSTDKGAVKMEDQNLKGQGAIILPTQIMYLVGGFNTSGKILVKLEIFPK